MLSEEYKTHKVFEEITGYQAFYNSLALNVFLWVNPGTSAITNLNSYIFTSIKGTLESINLVLSNGRINDAYSLLRKYYDSAIINTYEMLYLEKEITPENMIDNRVNDWLKGKEQLPPYSRLMQFIEKSPTVIPVNTLLYKDELYPTIRERANNHAHYNFFRYVLYNDNEIYLEDRTKHLDTFSKDILNIFILHFVYIFTINEHYMMASDHMDYLDVGDTPPENSQYWVAPFIQRVFDHIIKVHRPDLAEELKKSTSMHLD